MPLRSMWLPESHIFIHIYEGHVTNADVFQELDILLGTLSQMRCGVMVDLSQVSKIDVNYTKLPLWLTLASHSNLAGIIAVGLNGIVVLLLRRFTRMAT